MFYRLAERVAIGEARTDRDRSQPVEAPQIDGTRDFLEPHEIGERNQLTGSLRAHVDGFEVARRLPSLVRPLQDDPVLFSPIDKSRDDTRAEDGLEGSADIGQRYTQICRPIAIDHHIDLRLAFAVIGLNVRQSRVLGCLGHDDVPPLSELVVVGAAKDDRQGPAGLAEAPCSGRESERLDPRQIVKLPIPASHELLSRALTLVPQGQGRHDHAGVDIGARTPTAGAAEDAQHVATLLVLEHDVLDIPNIAKRVVETRTVRGGNHDNGKCAVLAWHVLDGQESEQTEAADEKQQGNAEYEYRMPDRSPQQPFIPACEVAIQAVECKCCLSAIQLVIGEELGSQHRHERQGYEAGETDRGCEGNAKFTEYETDVARHE